MAESDLRMQLEQQQTLIEQLKSMIRDGEEALKKKDAELKV